MVGLFPFLVVGLVGLSLGSFANVLIYRLNSADKVPPFWQGGSLCPRCKHKLFWLDNIPLLSFFLLAGRCRYCKKLIGWHYPVVEAITAATFIAIWLYFSHISGMANVTGFIALLLYCFIALILVVIFFSDLLYGLIPDEMILAGTIAAAIFNFQFSIFNEFSISNFKFQISNLGINLLVGAISALGFLLVVILTRFRGMGLGDVKLAFFLGFLLGWPKALVAFWLAFVLGGTFAIALLILKKTRLSATLALGPFLILGSAISALWSNQLLHLLGI